MNRLYCANNGFECYLDDTDLTGYDAGTVVKSAFVTQSGCRHWRLELVGLWIGIEPPLHVYISEDNGHSVMDLANNVVWLRRH